MSRKKSTGPAETQKAIVELRRVCNLTQRQLADEMGVTITTVSRWECVRPPRGISLVNLRETAQHLKRPDLAAIFQRELERELGATGDFLPLTNRLKPIHDAVSHLYLCYTNQFSRSTSAAFVKAVQAITMSHAALLKKAIAGNIPGDVLTLEQIEQTQLLLDQINEFQSLVKEQKQ